MKSNKILENLIYLTVLAIPLYLVRIKIGPVPTNVLEIMIATVFLVWIFLNKEKINLGEFFSKYKKYIYASSFMLAGILISAFLGGNKLESWGIIKGWFLVPIVFALLCGEIIKKEKIERVFLMYFLSTVIVSLVSIGYFLLGYITYDGRLSGIFNSPNYLAMYLAPAIMIFIFQTKKNKLKLILPLGLILTIIYLTYSYATWLALITSLFFILIWKNKKNIEKGFFLKIIAIGLLVIVLISSQASKDKFISLVNFDERSSLTSRIMIWRSSIKMIENNFWFGIGAGNFQKTYLEYQKFYPPYLNWAVSHPNNLYLTWWLYGGIFSLAGFLALVILFFRDIFRKKEPNRVLFIALGIMLIILIHGIFDTTYFKNDLAIIFWFSFLALK